MTQPLFSDVFLAEDDVPTSSYGLEQRGKRCRSLLHGVYRLLETALCGPRDSTISFDECCRFHEFRYKVSREASEITQSHTNFLSFLPAIGESERESEMVRKVNFDTNINKFN